MAKESVQCCLTGISKAPVAEKLLNAASALWEKLLEGKSIFVFGNSSKNNNTSLYGDE